MAAMESPVRVVIGGVGVANRDVLQRAHVMRDTAAKRAWLRECIPVFVDEGDVIIFVARGEGCLSSLIPLECDCFEGPVHRCC